MREGKLVVIRKQEGKNGSERFVRVITEEEGIEIKDVNEVLDDVIPKEIEKRDKDISTIDDKISNLEEKTKEFENDEEFQTFKKIIEDEKTKKHFEMLNQLNDLDRLKKQKEYALKELDDIKDWKNQFQKIKEDLQNSN
jgi:hypothetical protein